MMSLWDALRMNMMISYQELVRTFPSFLPGEVNKCLLIYVSDVCFLCKDDSAVSAGLMEEAT